MTHQRVVPLEPWVAGFLLATYGSLIFLISTLSRPTEDLFLPTGAIPHFLEFAGLGIIAWANARLHLENAWSALLAALVFCALFAAGDEIHQAFVPLRTCEWQDWLVDVLGSGAAIVALFHLENNGRLTFRRPRG